MEQTANGSLVTLFSPGSIAGVTIANRLIRAATWDPSLLSERRMNADVLEVYRRLAAGGIGAIITGDFSVVANGLLESHSPGDARCDFCSVRIDGFEDIARVVRQENTACRVFAQISGDVEGFAPSEVPSPYTRDRSAELSIEQIEIIIECFVAAIEGLKESGYDGVELHAAHGGLLSQFLSPYTNHRLDRYGGSVENRVRILAEIIARSRRRIASFPIIVKLNCTDYIPTGISFDTFPALASAVENAGADALELSGGMWDCLIRTEEELGFPPVPAPESHTAISAPEKQSYFLPAVGKLMTSIPIILTGGNRDAAHLEEILASGAVDFIGLCRPLIREPDLPNRWQKGGGMRATCTACNACIYDMWTHVTGGNIWVTRCLLDEQPEEISEARRWLQTWAQENRLPDETTGSEKVEER